MSLNIMLVLLHFVPICTLCVLIKVSSLPVQQSIFSSSQLCWFTTVTCTQDISSHTAVALPRLAALHPSALSGFGCPTTLFEKPACTRSCLPTLTCSSTSEWEDWTWLCAQSSSQTLTASQAQRPPLSPVRLSELYVPLTTRWLTGGLWLCERFGVGGIVLHHGSQPQVEGCPVQVLKPEKTALNPKDYGPPGFSVKHFFKIYCNILAFPRQKNMNTWQYSALQIIALQTLFIQWVL